MKPQDLSRSRQRPGSRCIAALAMAAATLSIDISAGAQTRSTRDTATTYGARLNAKGEPADLNPNRINNRANTRLETRLSLRVERYRPDNTNDPTAAFVVRPTDNARVGTVTTLLPLSSSTSTMVPRAHERTLQPSSSQSSSERTDDPGRSR